MLKSTLLAFAVAVLAACGGGGGTGSSNVPPTQPDVRQPLPRPAMASMTPGLTLLAGDVGGPGTLDGVGTDARLYSPIDIAIDASDNLYVTDSQPLATVLRKITPDATVTTLSASVPVSRFNAIDKAGNRYMAFRDAIVKVLPDGTSISVAGNPDSPGFVDGVGSDARLTGIRKMVTDASGNLYVINNKTICQTQKPFICTNQGGAIRKITPAGLVTTLAGFLSDANEAGLVDGTGTAARFTNPDGMAIDDAGNLFVGDSGVIRKISPSGVVTTLPKDAGTALFNVYDLAVNKTGEIFVLTFDAIYKVNPTGTTMSFATPPTGRSAFYSARMAIDSKGNLFVSDAASIVYKVSPQGVLTGFAGQSSFDGSAAANTGLALVQSPNNSSLSMDVDGNLYAIQSYTTISKTATDGTVTTLGKDTQFVDEKGAAISFSYDGPPFAVAVGPDRTIYLAGSRVIRKLAKPNVLTTLAGDGNFGFADGTGLNASFSSIRAMVSDSNGNLYVTEAHAIRKVTPAGVVTTLAGSSTSGTSDGTGVSAHFNFPSGISMDKNGNLYIADTENATIRKLSPEGIVTTVAGSPGMRGFADGTGAAARFTSPKGLAVDDAGNAYVVDNGTVRKVTPSGVVTTVAGNPQSIGTRLGNLPGSFAPLSGITYLGANVLAVTAGNSVLKLAVP